MTPVPALKPTWFYVQWCGSDCAGNPHPTHEAALKWIENAHASRLRAKAPFYGHYDIVERRTPTKETR